MVDCIKCFVPGAMTLNKQVIEELKKAEGETRGVVFQTDAKYVLSREGEEGLQKLEKRVKELGLGIDYRRAKTMEWYPIGFRVISLLLIKDIFGWRDSKIREMGKSAPKTSFVAKLFFRLFLSLAKLTKEVPRFWQEHHTIGKLQTVKLDEANKVIILRLSGVNLHPIFCLYLEGYFETVMALTRKGHSAKVKEIKCPFREKVNFHEYQITWQ